MQFKKAFLSLLPLVATAVAQAPAITDLLAQTESLSTLTSVLLQFPDLVQAIAGWEGNLTILAPSNDAFAALLETETAEAEAVKSNNTEAIQKLLMYHVLNGTFFSSAFAEGETAAGPTLLSDDEDYANLNGMNQVVLARAGDGEVNIYSGYGKSSPVSTADVEFDGGVVHIIDSVLTLPSKVSELALALNFTALAGALTTVDLVEAVDSLPQVTVFAPNNEAFAAIGNLLANITEDTLTSVLTYHVVANNSVYTFDGPTTLTTLEGGDLQITEQDGDWFVNGAEILGGKNGGVVVGNGVVYAINGVLNPAHGEATTTFSVDPSQSTQPPAFESASYVSDLPLTTAIGDATATDGPEPTDVPVEEGAAGKNAVSNAVTFGVAGLMVAVGAALF